MPLTGQKIELGPIGYVDDIDYIQTDQTDTMMITEDLVKKTQEGISLWEQLLRTTGGALEIDKDKTDITTISFRQTSQGLIVLQTPSPQGLGIITARDYMGQVRVLEHLKPTEARKTLGIYQSPSGSETAEVKYLSDKITKWGQNIRHSRLTHEDTRKAVKTTIGRTLIYPLKATAFSYTECQQLTSQFLQFALPKSGIVRTAARDLVCLSTAMMGFGYMDFWTYQLAEHIEVLLDHGNSDSLTSQLIHLLAQGHYVEAGIGGDLFLWEIDQIRWITETWLTRTIRDLNTAHIRLHHPIQQPQSWWIRDFFLMEQIAQTRGFSTLEMRLINEVRIYLKVLFVSDLCHADGRIIRDDIFTATPFYGTCSGQAYHWPNSATPLTHMKELWTRALQSSLGLDNNLRLPYALQSTAWANHAKSSWIWWLSGDKKNVYRQSKEGFVIYRQVNGSDSRTRQKKYELSSSTACIDVVLDKCQPISVVSVGTYVAIHSQGIFSDIVDLKQQIPDWTLRSVHCSDSSAAILAKQIESGQAKMVCDGSYKNKRSSSAFISVYDHTLYGTNIVPGSLQCQSAYRGELAGILGIIVYINILSEKYHIVRGRVTIGCDCEGALKAVQRCTRVTSRWKNFDLLFRIRNEMQKSMVQFFFYKIKAHQDLLYEYKDLDMWEQANVQADLLAKDSLSEYIHQQCPPIVMGEGTSNQWVLSINNTPIGNNPKKKISSHIWDLRGKLFWCKRLQIPASASQYIWWEIINAVGNGLPDFKRQRYTKVMANIAPVGSILLRRNNADTDVCPLCSESESNLHLWTCSHSRINELIDNGFKDIMVWMQAGPIKFIAFFQEFLQNLRASTEIFGENLRSTQDPLLQAQTAVQGTLWGFYHRQWENILAIHFANTRRSPVQWLAQLTIKMWHLWDSLWDYRNSEKHTSAGTRQENETLNQSIQEVYDKLPPIRMLTPIERKFFHKPCSERITQSVKTKKKWLRDATILLS